MKKFLTVVVLSGFISLGLGMRSSYASEIDALLQKLIDKGVLSASEAQEIRSETNEEMAKVEKKKEEDIKTLVSKSAPNIKFKGDMRLRVQDEIRKGSNVVQGQTAHRVRERIRLRLGAEGKVNDQVKAHFGIASGSNSDPRSTNQMLQDSFAKKAVWIDYAYAEWFPVKWAALFGGRTGVRSHEILFTYGLGKNWNLELDYYRSDLTSSLVDSESTQKVENLFQADLNFKF